MQMNSVKMLANGQFWKPCGYKRLSIQIVSKKRDMNGLTITDGYTQNKVAWAVYAGEILHPRLKILTDHSQATSCRVQ